ncbi:MAG: O-antigen ligase family protein [Coriobacteriia bacterium]|nr:O-antigen ligase family protein [Coriobacteriia bacterium]
MGTIETDTRRLERYAWLALLGCIGIVPLAVSKLPTSELPLTISVFGFPQTVILAAGVAVALILWAAALWTRQTTLMVSRPMVAFAVLWAWAVVATAAGYEPLRSLLGRSIAGLSLAHITMYTALGFLVTQLTDSKQRMRTLTWAVAISGGLVALIALTQQFWHVDLLALPVESWMVGRGFSTIGNPDHLGTYLVLPAILSLALAVTEETAKRRIAGAALVGVLLAALTGTLTRGAWVAALIGVLLAATLVWRSQRAPRSRQWALIVFGVAVAAVVLSLAMSDQADLASRFRVTTPQTSEAQGALGTVNAISSDRLNVWRSSLRIVFDRPLTGTGPAAFELGWYPNAIAPSSGGGAGGLADDPHSLLVYILATTGVPGFIAYLFAFLSALVYGARTSVALSGRGPLSGTAVYYVAWFIAAVALQIALLVAAVSTPIAMYAFVSFAVLLRPLARAVQAENPILTRHLPAVTSLVLALLFISAISPTLSAEIALGRTLRDGDLDRGRAAAARAPWNLDVQKMYFHLRISRMTDTLTSDADSARANVSLLVADLADAGARQPREYYYPSVRAQVLTQASERLSDPSIAEAAIAAADDALAIMPASIPTRVHRALALSDLERWKEMANTLEGYWENELGSPYPGILYAQALALSGDMADAERVFTSLQARFPQDASIEEARQQTDELLKQ